MTPVLLWHCMEVSVTPIIIILVLNLLTVHQAGPLRRKEIVTTAAYISDGDTGVYI